MVVAGALGGLLWAMIPGVLKTHFNTNEILVSLLLVYVAEQILAKAALGFLRNPEGMGFPGSRNLAQWDASANPDLIAGTGMHWGVVAAFIAVIPLILFASYRARRYTLSRTRWRGLRMGIIL